jgi:predicted Zn finger-like uncharacterized protein
MKITCPDCDAVFRVAEDWPDGKKVRCPECASTFSLSSGIRASKPRRPHEDDEDDDYGDAPRRGGRPGKKKSAVLVLIPILVGGLLLVVLAGAGVWYLASRLGGNDKDTIDSKARVVSRKGGSPVRLGGGGGQGGGGQGGAALGEAPALNKEAPDIEGEDVDGQHFKLSDYRGKVVVLDFWGHW